MPNEKLKSENYQNLGGINTKISQYLNSPLEFLDIKNFDFQTPGALTQRWGSTQYVSQNFGAPIYSIYEYEKLNGASYVVVGHTGGIWAGATTGNSQGLSLTNLSATLALVGNGQLGVPIIGYRQGAGIGDGLNVNPGYFPYNDDFSQVIFRGPEYVHPFTQGQNVLSFVTFQNYLFGADGNKYFKYDGATTYHVGLPYPKVQDCEATGGSFYMPTAELGASFGWAAGYYYYYGSYVNNRGLESPIWPICVVAATAITAAIHFSANPANYVQPRITMHTPLAYGISSINVYSYFSPTPLSSIEGVYNASLSLPATTYSSMWNANYVFLRNVPSSGSTLTDVDVGTTISLEAFAKLQSNQGTIPNLVVNDYIIPGVTFIDGFNSGQISEIAFPNFSPKFLEVYKERIFSAGYSGAQSTVYFSDPGEPEGVQSDSNIEVRTNDGDFITALKAYGTRLYIFKRNSLHSLLGDGPENYFIQEVSTNYGAVNNRCVVVFDDIMVFLDRTGVMMYNGSQLESLSTKVQPAFNQMNYNAALNSAIMTVDKIRNQILVSFPTGNSQVNDTTGVYDYLAKAWTFYTGYVPTAYASVQGRNITKNTFYGNASGVINWFGQSFLLENGAGYTLSFKTRFLHDMGESIEKQWRRLYINADTSSATLIFPLKFYQDYGASVVYSVTFNLGQFQNRIDFGIPAKAVAFELANIGANSPVKIYGFTFESRLQRRV